MSQALTFLGEVVVLREIQPEKSFGAFELLPNRALVSHLAGEFADRLELMPYQELGEPMELAVSVYLRPQTGDGRIIAVVSRERYPEDLRALGDAVERARRRLELLYHGVGSRFEEASVVRARQALSDLAARIAKA
jgi:hypothetical protein